MAGLLKKLDRGLENLSIGLGYGLQNQLEGMYQMARHPVQTAKGLLDFGQEVVKNPAIAGGLLADTYKRGTSGLLGFGEVLGENLSPGMFRRPPTAAELTTYHGSPHLINNVTPDAPLGKFDLSRIGTGEGNQTFGYGIYLAETPGVADTYRSMEGRFEFKPVSPEVDAQIKAATNFADRAAIGLRDALDTNNGDLQKTAKSLRLYAQQAEAPEYKTAYSRLAEIVESGGIQPVRAGYFYTVDLPDEHIAKMLDWDAPIGDELAKRLSEAGFPVTAIAKGKMGTAGDFYKALGNGKMASERLRSLGIPGIKYLDGGSRSAGEGTRNFVIFDPEVAKILKRE